MTDWLEKEVVRGMQALFILNLDFTPSADTIKATGQVWIGTLRGLPHTWLEDRDKPRIQTAFRNIAATSMRWPAPKNFLDAMPPLPEQNKLTAPATRHSPESQRMVKDLLTRLGSKHA